jgi:type I restriction enzyme S subunit
MIDVLKPYPEYKDSRLPWLGRIPVQRLKLLLREVDSRSSSGEEQLLRVSQYTGVTQRRASDSSGEPDTRASSLVGYKRVTVGDLVINIMLAWNGSMGVSRYDGIASPAYCVYRFQIGARPWYYHELLRLPTYKGRIKTASTGVVESRLRLYSNHLGCIEAILPPPEEQDAIVRFLDHANRRIERYIRAKKKLIALLNEQKQAIIHRAVTRGLDPNVRLKPSGVPWLGDIPEHWEVVPLKSVCFIQSGVTLGKNYFGANLVAYPYLRVANVQAGRLDLNLVKTLRLPDSEARRSLLVQGDVLMTEGGDPDKLGRGCVWEGKISPCLHQNHIFAVRPTLQRLLPQFLEALLISSYAKDYFLRTAKQTTNLASTNKTTIGNLRIVLPSISEQTRILEGLELEGEPVNEAISRSEREIALIREYQTRLVADVVTGQIDVRAAAAKLPEEPGEVDVEPIEDLTEDESEPSEFEEMAGSGTIT